MTAYDKMVCKDLWNQGFDIEDIAEILDVDEEEVEECLESC